MDKKLTLKLKGEIIDRAKDYAQKQNRSLSRIIESYLEALVVENDQLRETEISPFVESLSSELDLSSDNEIQGEYREYLNEKYK